MEIVRRTDCILVMGLDLALAFVVVVDNIYRHV